MVYVTQTVANVVVYVDEMGQPYSTSTAPDAGATSIPVAVTESSSAAQGSPSASSPVAPAPPSSAPPSSSVVAVVEPSLVAVDLASPAPTTTSEQAPPPVTSAATPVSPPPSSAAPAPVIISESKQPQPAPSSAGPQSSAAAPSVPVVKDDNNGKLGLSITYDPYTGSQQNTNCKSAQDIANDFTKMKSYSAVRIYGSDCNMIPVAIQNAVKNGQKIMAGVYMSHSGSGQDLGQTIQAYKDAIDKNAGGSWDVIALFSVENERVNEHDMTASEVVDAINQARGQLRGSGYNGPVGAVETVPATIDNPAICRASDVVMVNCHAFFDSNTEAKDAGTFVKSQVDRVKQACDGKRVVVTESGWPHQGNANGKAVPSMENQRLALDSIRQNFNSDMFLFSAFDSMWKSDWASSFNAERFWGIMQ